MVGQTDGQIDGYRKQWDAPSATFMLGTHILRTALHDLIYMHTKKSNRPPLAS